jgi:hypothetical protein
VGRTLTVATALLLALAAAAPSAVAAKRKVPVGFHGVDYDREAAWAPAEVQGAMWREMARTGVESARVIFDWSEAQKQSFVPVSFHETDPLVANATAQGIELLPVVIYAPPWACEVPSKKASAPSDLAAYGAYLRTLYERGGVRGHFDVAALNAYTRDSKNLVEIVRRARKVMDERGDRKRAIRVTEFGASASAGRLKVGRDQDHLQTTDRKLAKLVLSAYDALAANRKKLRIERAYWYTWASTYEARDGAGIFDFAGLVAYREGAPSWSARQALGAYRKSARLLQGE